MEMAISHSAKCGGGGGDSRPHYARDVAGAAEVSRAGSLARHAGCAEGGAARPGPDGASSPAALPGSLPAHLLPSPPHRQCCRALLAS